MTAGIFEAFEKYVLPEVTPKEEPQENVEIFKVEEPAPAPQINTDEIAQLVTDKVLQALSQREADNGPKCDNKLDN